MDPAPPPSSAADSANSSPRSHPDVTAWDESKLRLMCSYGGHIIPRPHDKSLCYVGGDTRIVVVDRRSSLSDLLSRLSHSLLNGRRFTLKYQLPSEDLDSLISLAADEDLDNMIEEYDRTTAASSPLKPARLRLFLFPSKPETAASMGSLLDDAKSETWFVDALNGSGLLPRVLSESAAANDVLLDLDRDGGKEEEEEAPVKAQEVVVETSSSFGSSSSSPPVRVRGGEVGLDEQFSSLHVNNMAAPPLPYVKSGDRVMFDDEKSEKSDHGTVAPTRLRKPPLPLPLPLPLQAVQRKLVDVHNLPSPDSKHACTGGYNLPSPDSIASDCSIASGGGAQNESRATAADATQMEMQQQLQHVADHEWRQQQQQQQQYMNMNIPTTHNYIQQQQQQQQQNAVPLMPAHTSYYQPMYLHHHQQQPDQQQYPSMYLVSPTTHQPSYDASPRPLTPQPNMHQMVQVPVPHQFQHHYNMGVVSQMQPSQSHTVAPGGGGGGGYDHQYSNIHVQDQQQAAYYGQQMPPPQYQTMTPAAAVMFAQASAQITNPADTNPQHS